MKLPCDVDRSLWWYRPMAPHFLQRSPCVAANASATLSSTSVCSGETGSSAFWMASCVNIAKSEVATSKRGQVQVDVNVFLQLNRGGLLSQSNTSTDTSTANFRWPSGTLTQHQWAAWQRGQDLFWFAMAHLSNQNLEADTSNTFLVFDWLDTWHHCVSNCRPQKKTICRTEITMTQAVHPPLASLSNR